jgi:hypothetical protein
MTRPKYLYALSDELHVHASSAGAVTVQQADPIGRDQRDSMLHLDREDAAKLRDALDQWLKESDNAQA